MKIEHYFLLFIIAELYSSHTSSSFPASEGFATPNSYTNDLDMKEKTMENDEKSDKISSKMDKSNKGSKNGKDGCYQCQFCDKKFPRLGYLKKHEQVSDYRHHLLYYIMFDWSWKYAKFSYIFYHDGGDWLHC